MKLSTKMRYNVNALSLISTTLLALCSRTGLAELDASTAVADTRSNGESVRWNAARAVNDFGFKLTTTLIKQDVGANIVISPTAVAGLLAMTLLGSVGPTYDELAKTLGFSQDILLNRENHQQLGDILRFLNSEVTSSKTLYADAVMVDERTHIREIYKDYLKRVYDGDAISVNFNNRLEAMRLINSWVKNHTNNKIEDFLEQPLPEKTQVVLLSALYFNGQWERPFFAEFTRKMPFKTKPTMEVMVDFMLHMGVFNYTYSSSNGVHMIAFPYNDSTTTMYVLKPYRPESTTLTELLERLDYDKIELLIDQMKEKNCAVRFPKMEIKTKASLEKSLQELGVRSLFSPTEANMALMIDTKTANHTEEDLISRINSGDAEETRDLKNKLNSLHNPGINIDTVLHDVKISINEYGTEAAAATAGIFTRTAQQFYANSPFYMFIRNDKTKLVTFSAAIFNPLT